MPLRWIEVEKGKKLSFTPEEALRRIRKVGDLWAEMPRMKQVLLPTRRSVERGRPRPRTTNDGGRGRPPSNDLPKPDSQSGRRLFLLVKGDSGNELWLAIVLDMVGFRSTQPGSQRVPAPM